YFRKLFNWKNWPQNIPYLPKCSAGLELLSRYEDTWAALHRRTKECAGARELVDSKVVMLSAHWEKKKTELRVTGASSATSRKNKRNELEIFKVELDVEHTQKVLEMERTQQMRLKEQQKVFEEAVSQDVE
ncbi:hypothetical protein EI555_004922, partial [Monodon monoceros]